MMLIEKRGKIVANRREIEDLLLETFDDWRIDDAEDVEDLCEQICFVVHNWGGKYAQTKEKETVFEL